MATCSSYPKVTNFSTNCPLITFLLAPRLFPYISLLILYFFFNFYSIIGSILSYYNSVNGYKIRNWPIIVEYKITYVFELYKNVFVIEVTISPIFKRAIVWNFEIHGLDKLFIDSCDDILLLLLFIFILLDIDAIFSKSFLAFSLNLPNIKLPNLSPAHTVYESITFIAVINFGKLSSEIS